MYSKILRLISHHPDIHWFQVNLVWYWKSNLQRLERFLRQIIHHSQQLNTFTIFVEVLLLLYSNVVYFIWGVRCFVKVKRPLANGTQMSCKKIVIARPPPPERVNAHLTWDVSNMYNFCWWDWTGCHSILRMPPLLHLCTTPTPQQKYLRTKRCPWLVTAIRFSFFKVI